MSGSKSVGLSRAEIWRSFINKENFFPPLAGGLSDARNTVMSELKNAIEKERRARGDYTELLVLFKAFLGGDIGSTFKMKTSGMSSSEINVKKDLRYSNCSL